MSLSWHDVEGGFMVIKLLGNQVKTYDKNILFLVVSCQCCRFEAVENQLDA